MDAFLSHYSLESLPASDQAICESLKTQTGAKIHLLGPQTWVSVSRNFFLPPPETFAALWDSHPLTHHTIVLQGREIPLPRWSTAYGRDYEYSNSIAKAEPHTELTSQLLELVSEACGGIPFNQCLCNWYQPEHYVGPHSDNTRPLVPRSPIAGVSLGATRQFHLKPIGKTGASLTINARHGDLIVMGGLCQQTHKHEIVKTTKKEAESGAGNRVSFTFRWFKV